MTSLPSVSAADPNTGPDLSAGVHVRPHGALHFITIRGGDSTPDNSPVLRAKSARLLQATIVPVT